MFVSRIAPVVALAVATLHLDIPERHRAYEDRYRQAADEAAALYAEWFGELPGEALTLRSDDMRDVPWLAAEQSRMLERAVLEALARQFWTPAGGGRSHQWLIDGLAEYSRARAMEQLFAGERIYERRYFAGLVPYVIRGVSVTHDATNLGRVAQALRTLERLVGWSTLQQALEEFRPAWRGGSAEPGALAVIVTRVSGRNLSWFFDRAFDPATRFDYAIDRVTSEPAAGGAMQITITPRRLGAGAFPVELLLQFENGEEIREAWDGRDETATFVYQSPSPLASVAVDPDRVLWLDDNRANNFTRVEAPQSSAEWTLRWMIWLQDLMLTYGAFA